MKVLFNADDFGLTKGVTDGVIKAHTDGVVSSTTLMMNGRATDYAIEKATNHPSLHVGIHLVLTAGTSLNSNVENLLNNEGLFKFKKTNANIPIEYLAEIKQEWTAQIEAFLATNLTLHHIDSHHHVHGWDPLKEIIVELAHTYNVPVRYVDSIKSHKNILLTEALWLDFYGENISENIFQQLHNLDAKSVEVMTHPAFIDRDLYEVSSYVDARKRELEILCSLNVPNWVELI